jgi:hypothetical protein
VVRDGQVLQRSGFVSNRILAALMQQTMSSDSSYLLATLAKSPYRTNNATWASYLESSGGLRPLLQLPSRCLDNRTFLWSCAAKTDRTEFRAHTCAAYTDEREYCQQCDRLPGNSLQKARPKKGVNKKNRLIFLNGTKFIGKQRDVEKARST